MRTVEIPSGSYHTLKANSLALTADGRYALLGTDQSDLGLWDLWEGKWLRAFEGHTGGVESVVLSADGRWALSGSWDNTVRLWGGEQREMPADFRGTQGLGAVGVI